MSSVLIYLDESGDLGWNFNHEFRNGGSSRFLTISATAVPEAKRHLPGRLIKNLYQKFEWDPKKEKKWANMSFHERIIFAKEASKLKINHPEIQYFSITVYKPGVQEHIRKDSNKLYNFMIKLMLLHYLKQHNQVALISDTRNIKIESGKSLIDYLIMQLWFELKVATEISGQAKNSADDKGIQFADMLSGCVQKHYEDEKSDFFMILENHIETKELFLNQFKIPVIY